MYTCDICGQDVLDPDNLIPVWEGDQEFGWDSRLVCSDCLEADDNTYLRLADDDPQWDYPKHIRYRIVR